MHIKVLGIDIAKNIFELYGVDEHGDKVLSKRLSRSKLAKFIAQLPVCLIGMEACGGAHYWARKFQEFGHEVKLMNPQFVKPYVKSNKNDAQDAAAICEAVTRPSMRFVAIKQIEQHDIQAVHRVRALIVKERTALVNQVRGLLAEYGIVVAQGVHQIRKQLPLILEDAENELSDRARRLFHDLYEEMVALTNKVKQYDVQIESLCKSHEVCQRLRKLEGVGALTATALVASIGDAKVFKNGREMAAFIGLVPRQHSSGGKQRLLGISKRGDRYLRCLLVHGARAAITRSKKMSEKKSIWVNNIIERRGKNRAIVALANKQARIMWALMAKEDVYQQAV